MEFTAATYQSTDYPGGFKEYEVLRVSRHDDLKADIEVAYRYDIANNGTEISCYEAREVHQVMVADMLTQAGTLRVAARDIFLVRIGKRHQRGGREYQATVIQAAQIAEIAKMEGMGSA